MSDFKAFENFIAKGVAKTTGNRASFLTWLEDNFREVARRDTFLKLNDYVARYGWEMAVLESVDLLLSRGSTPSDMTALTSVIVQARAEAARMWLLAHGDKTESRIADGALRLALFGRESSTTSAVNGDG